jgi:hypothetical protein
MPPLFTYTAPHIARKPAQLSLRHLPPPAQKPPPTASEGSVRESADTGEGDPHLGAALHDRTQLVRIWTGGTETTFSPTSPMPLTSSGAPPATTPGSPPRAPS